MHSLSLEKCKNNRTGNRMIFCLKWMEKWCIMKKKGKGIENVQACSEAYNKAGGEYQWKWRISHDEADTWTSKGIGWQAMERIDPAASWWYENSEQQRQEKIKKKFEGNL